MQAISVYEIGGLFNYDDITLENKSRSEERELNGTQEVFRTEMFVNETNGNYVRCSFALDEEFKIRARVLNTDVTAVVIKSTYEGYFNTEDGTLTLLATKVSEDNICDFVSNQFGLDYNKKIFNLETIMDEASDVRKTQFRNVRIQTLSGSSLNGSRVNQTELYDLMYQNGELSTIAVTYPINNVEISFSVSTSGSIVIFSTIENNEILTLIEEIFLY